MESIPLTSADPNIAEEWRPIHGAPNYEVSNFGRVRSMARGKLRILRIQINPRTKYPQADLSVGGRGQQKRRTVAVHRLVAEAFLGPLRPGAVVNHKDRNRANCALSNLEVLHQGFNLAHRDINEWVRLAVREEVKALIPILFQQLRGEILALLREAAAREQDPLLPPS
jgi:hypothetical protein